MTDLIPDYGTPTTSPDFGGDPSNTTTPGQGGSGTTGPCPPGQERHPTRGDCRYPGDYPCPTGLCKDRYTGECRTFNPNREKINETDSTVLEGGGVATGRGYCKWRHGGGNGEGGGGGAGGGGGVGGVGGGAPGGPGGAGGTGARFGIMDPNARFEDLFGRTDDNFQSIWDQLLPIARGEQTRYNPTTMGMLEGRARVDRAGNIAAGREEVLSDAITRGMGRSGPTSRAVEGVVNTANTTYANVVTQLRVKKVEQDFEDRMAALDRMRAALQDRQQYILGLDQNAADREKAIANIALGYARIAAEERMLRERLRVDLQIANNANATNILLGARPI